MRPAEHCLLKEVLWGAHMGSSTAVTNKKMFVALFWNCLLGQLWGIRDKSSPLAICCFWPKMVLPSLSCEMACDIQQAWFRITLGFLFKLKSTVKRQKFANIEIISNTCHVIWKQLPERRPKPFWAWIASPQSMEVLGRATFNSSCCCHLSGSKSFESSDSESWLLIRITWGAWTTSHARPSPQTFRSCWFGVGPGHGIDFVFLCVCVCVWSACATRINLYVKESILLTLATVVPV